MVLLLLVFLFNYSHSQLIKRDNSSIQQIWDYTNQNTKIQGISLGGWLVLEPYITPSLFTQFGSNDSEIPVDEYTFTQTLGKNESLTQLENHWSTYYTETDFKDIKNYGFNTVRIPIGYWAFSTIDNDPYVQGQEKYLDQALDWAQQNDLKVWLDLHGVPGSQNGFDNSGKRGNVEWLKADTNIQLTYQTLDYIFGKYSGDDFNTTIIGIEIVNEPASGKLNQTKLIDFYYNSYDKYRITHNSTNYFVIQDAFEPIGFWNNHLNNVYNNVSRNYLNDTSSNNYFYGIVVDHHHYEVFTQNQLENSSEDRIKDIRNYASSISNEQQYHPSLVGEFSGAITDCAKWLNGVGTGARFDGTFNESQLIRNDSKTIDLSKDTSTITTNCSQFKEYKDFSKDHKRDIRKFIEIQLIEYEKNTAGWIFWNYKTEDAIEWDFKKLHENKLFPDPFDNYQYFYKNSSDIILKNSATSISLNKPIFKSFLFHLISFCLFISI